MNVEILTGFGEAATFWSFIRVVKNNIKHQNQRCVNVSSKWAGSGMLKINYLCKYIHVEKVMSRETNIKIYINARRKLVHDC